MESVTASWTEKFDRWWAANYVEDGTTPRTKGYALRVACRAAFMAGAAAERAEHEGDGKYIDYKAMFEIAERDRELVQQAFEHCHAELAAAEKAFHKTLQPQHPGIRSHD